jgi:hypothetical protein
MTAMQGFYQVGKDVGLSHSHKSRAILQTTLGPYTLVHPVSSHGNIGGEGFEKVPMARTLSSAQTFVMKAIFPVVWIAGFGAGPGRIGDYSTNPPTEPYVKISLIRFLGTARFHTARWPDCADNPRHPSPSALQHN